jgi:DUF971 family protein
MVPKQIKIFEKENLLLKWDDNSESKINLKYLREECPCAGCKGETVLLKTYRPVKPAAQHPEMFKIKDIKTVGGYAIQIIWKDGHDTGIYTWEYLKQLASDQNNDKKHNYDNLI